MVLYEQLSRSESINAISVQSSVAYPNSNGSTLFDRGWQQPLDHHEALTARRVKDAEGTAQPLVLDSARWLGYIPCFPPASHFARTNSYIAHLHIILFITSLFSIRILIMNNH